MIIYLSTRLLHHSYDPDDESIVTNLSFDRNLPPSFWDSSWVSPSLPREEAYQDPYSGSLLHHNMWHSVQLRGPLRPLCFKFEPPWSIWTIWAILGHSVPIWPFWVISDDDDDCAGDPWQQYMAAQMAVGGGYSPHMYSHRLVTFFTLFLLMLVSFFLSHES